MKVPVLSWMVCKALPSSNLLSSSERFMTFTSVRPSSALAGTGRARWVLLFLRSRDHCRYSRPRARLSPVAMKQALLPRNSTTHSAALATDFRFAPCFPIAQLFCSGSSSTTSMDRPSSSSTLGSMVVEYWPSNLLSTTLIDLMRTAMRAYLDMEKMSNLRGGSTGHSHFSSLPSHFSSAPWSASAAAASAPAPASAASA
mmetsp:Transcript_4504/g.13153  ORF Transcript_4504/g.13153 Transcript_4504/m.13153 type:complete len:200 (-) Transcript_4504:14-613(-)